MTDLTKFQKAFNILKQLEYGKKPEKFLHQNENEDFLTLGGCYEKFWKTKIDWEFVHKTLELCQYDKKRASVLLYNDSIIRAEVAQFFKVEFWDKMRLDEIQSQKICNEIFLHGVHRGIHNAIKLAQKQIRVKEDGIIGSITVKALNNFNEDVFDKEFDKLELMVYNSIVDNNPSLEYARQGFVNRGLAV